MDAADKVPFASLLETGTIDVVGMGGAGRSGGLALGGTGFGNKWAVSYASVIVVFGWMCLATDVTCLGVKPSLP